MTGLRTAQDARNVLTRAGWLPLVSIRNAEHWVKGPRRAILVYQGIPERAERFSVFYVGFSRSGRQRKWRVI